ncbi:MAG: type IX secretion system sortase PorU, partial [Bacteroidetes bacterium]|nr:type IX secretion system sortase PorU [Bacteroidota bacterium]
QAALDSAKATLFDERAALAVARGLFSTSRTLDLPTLAQPRLRVLAADYDEVRLPASTDAAALVDELDQSPAAVLGLGLERKRPAASLHTRLLTYDKARSTLRRYRRLVVAVDYAARQAGQWQTVVASDNPHLSVDESVLAGGVVYKITFDQDDEGIYRIDRDFLTSLPGFELSPGSIDPNNVKVYGNGGAPVPALNSAPRIADLAENPVFVRGGGDGSFDEGDAVWFYAKGPTGWQSVIQRDFRGDIIRDDQGNIIRYWEHYVHPFSNENVYFIKIDETPNVRLEQEAFPNFQDASPLTQIRGRHFVDLDDFLWARESGGTGHTWVSNLIALGGGILPILENVSLPGLEAGTVVYRARAAIQSNPSASVFYNSNGTQLASVNYGGVANTPTTPVARSGVAEFSQEVGSGQLLNLELELENRSGSPKTALDWLRVFYPKALRATDGVVRFHTPIGQAGQFEMILSGFSQEPQVWDVTEPGAFRRLGVQTSGGTYRVQVEVADPEQPRELIAFDDGAVRSLVVEEVCAAEDGCRVGAQNLHGIQSFPTFVIVAPAIFRSHAEELAEKRRQEGLVVEVVDLQQIYNEFSGGVPDARAIRDYFKFLYDRAPDEERLLRYALLFGDGHYNYRELGTTPEFPNWVLPFETEESWNPETSYTSDDYYGLLDDNEGLWPYTQRTFTGSFERLNERVDLGIGRFTVRDEDEARIVLDKINHYESAETYASWRTRYLFLADDGPTGLAGIQDDHDLHTQNTDVVAELLKLEAPEIDQKKVYAISYTRVFRNGWRIPDARQDILTAINEGVLVVNYSGHGGEEGLAQEDLFNIEDARSLENLDHLPIFITATCSFGRWDQTNAQSAAEELLLNPNGGAIAMLTTVRTVYTTGVSTTTLNVGLNVELNRQLFRRDEDGLPRRLGDALRHTKNTRVGYEGNNRKFSLLGDPTMRPGVPSHIVAVT